MNLARRTVVLYLSRDECSSRYGGGDIFGIFSGILFPMKNTIDASGRLVIPKKIRQEAQLEPSVPLTIRYRNGRIEIEPAPLPVKQVRKGRLLVAVPHKERERLTHKKAEETRWALRMDRVSLPRKV